MKAWMLGFLLLFTPQLIAALAPTRIDYLLNVPTQHGNYDRIRVSAIKRPWTAIQAESTTNFVDWVATGYWSAYPAESIVSFQTETSVAGRRGRLFYRMLEIDWQPPWN